MAKPFLCRLGLAQISVNPAYADELVSCIQEPTFPAAENEKIGLFSVSGLEEIGQLQRNLGEKYIAHLNRKIESVVRFAAKNGVELLVFPEYSIPSETLPLCYALSEELRIALIAGSHVITLSDPAQQVYRDLDLHFGGNSTPPEDSVRQAACIVFVPKERPIGFVKFVRSKWESYLVKGFPSFHAFQMNAKSGRIEVQVLICIEALVGKPPKEKHTLPRLVAITAFTPSTEPFHDEGKRNLLKGKCTLFANVAEFGGSRTFARADHTNLWFTDRGGSRAIPKGSEALLVMEADLEKQFEVRQSVTEHTALTDLRVFPILHTGDSVESQQYAEIRDLCSVSNPTHAEICNQVSAFTTLNTRVFPQLLQEKLSHYIGHIAPTGTISTKDACEWITPILIRDSHSTNRLRWELCNQSIETVNALLISGRFVHKTKELMEVYGYLLTSRNALAGSIQLRKDDGTAAQLKPSAQQPSTTSPFIDRDQAFDKIRQFFNQQQTSVLILGGMKGIGKSALILEGFRQAIPPGKRIWLQLTEGISYQRLLAELAFECNLQLPDNLNLTTPATEADVRRRILSYLGQGPGAVVVFDEFQFLLNASAEIENPSIRALLLGLAEAGQRGKSKYFFISHVFPRLGASFENVFTPYTLHGLEPTDTRRLLIQWVQSERDDLRGQLPAPSERLISTLAGHPLATKLAARLWASHPTADIAEEFSIFFKELRDTIVFFILEKLTLSPAERELLSFASILRVPAPRELFLNWHREDASRLLNSLAGHYLIESSDRGYQLHPLVRSFFSNALQPEQKKAWHKIAAKFYLHDFERLKTTTKQIIPEYLGEAVHHFLAAGDRQRVQEFAFYAQELRPVALDHFRSGESKVALKDYEVLLDLDKNDVDAHFHISLICAGLGRWPDAEYHFGKAIALRPKAPWILQAFGKAKLRAGKIAEGEALLLEAEKSNPNHSPTLVELGRLREKQKISDEAEDYYRRAINADPNNSYAYYQLARLLYREGDTQQAYEMAMAALVSNPLNVRNKTLVQELKNKIAELAGADKRAAPTPVRIRCIEKTDGTAIYERVHSIGGINSNGKQWKTKAVDAMAYIESGKYAFFVENPDGRRIDVVVSKDAAGHKYLTTIGDSAQQEILHSLPACPK